MKNENIDKKSKGYKIGFILMSVLASLLLIFNLMSLYSLGVKDKQIKDLTTETTQVDNKPNFRISEDSLSDLTNTQWTINSPSQWDFSSISAFSWTSLDITGEYVYQDTTYAINSIRIRRVNDTYNNSFYIVFSSAMSNDEYGSSNGILLNKYRNGINQQVLPSYSNIDFADFTGFTITGGTDTDNSTLITFLTLNGTYQNIDNTPDSPISYGGEYIEVIDFSKTNPLIYWSNTLYNNGSMYQGTGSTIYINGVEFVSNGFLFNKIKIITLSLGGVNLTTDNYVIDDDITTAYSGYSMFFTMFYEYESIERNYSIHVCAVGTHYLPHSTASTNFGICYNPLEKQWVNEEYKTLNVVTASDDICSVPSYNNLTGLELLRLQSDFTSTTLGDTNIFALLSQAFSAFASILAIRIIPGISIGLLIFIPLVVSIIITIIKLIGK